MNEEYKTQQEMESTMNWAMFFFTVGVAIIVLGVAIIFTIIHNVSLVV